ncbi:type II toxin-antitoxin system Phd/YefM family antitoxin [Flavobacterium frigidarium]|uniref:type II toxin-antitoxin system Phd/YefM family antitoxin n=1 Tax=Flavobacterium frigidarium TaxID=99286 RepID=UPI0003F67490|nr:type II toxin-antitoxin system Phd/YefM family antitoxin [Flavobacterium frigidarium]
MIAINVTEFRGNMKKYLEAAENEKLIIHSAKGKAYAIVPIEEIEESIFTLSQEQKEAIDQALNDVTSGKVFSHKEAMEKIKSRHPKYFK